MAAQRYHHTGIRGLDNYHLSCCVNALLQAFAATAELTELLERWNSAGVGTSSRNVPLQIKRVLTAMQSDRPQPVPHRDFLHCLDKNRIRLGTQHDADELFHFILNFTQQQMDDQTVALDIQNLYKIPMESRLQCLACSAIQTCRNYLLSLPLYILHSDSSLGCIASFFADQELRDDNCCFCAQCEVKTAFKRGVKLVSLPRILCFHLKRFRNHKGLTRKLDCSVTFPKAFDFSGNLREIFCAHSAENDSTYTLYAVIVHSGTAVCGHYTVYIHHHGNQCWYYADDDHVRKVSWEDVQRTYGGGPYRNTAYMLMYRRSGNRPKKSHVFRLRMKIRCTQDHHGIHRNS
ncbi:ubl carboxyl-terminal hydrolase 18 [Thalassophryne amazonica]|uniref:ubl carboxyl-terminal hydrolase 18 n=1 Tax=Thalassophryne amazonica TaxID=390379 RepID=UPI001470904D|nr:ubl carboxyl-terminal hydrolase 18 [Thalassophryne amazonica]